MAEQIAPASPLPWKLAAERGGAVVDARGWGVVEAWIGVGRDAKANAAHIVRCVNTYPELLSALKGLLAAVSAIVAADEVKSLDGIVAALPEAKRAIDAAIVAVARAEGASHGE